MRLLADSDSDDEDVDVDCKVDDIAAGPTLLLIGLRVLFFLRILEREVEFKVHWNRHESNLAAGVALSTIIIIIVIIVVIIIIIIKCIGRE